MRLIDGARHGAHDMTLTGNPGDDAAAVRDAVAALRAVLPELADDPLLLLPSEVRSSRAVRGDGVPPSESVIDDDLRGGRRARPGRHLRGRPGMARFRELGRAAQLARDDHVQPAVEPLPPRRQGGEERVRRIRSGTRRAFAGADGAMRASAWRSSAVPPRSLAPGKYRAYLAPAAMEEIAGLLCWGAFSGRALATQQSALSKMRTGETLDRRVTIAEDTGARHRAGLPVGGLRATGAGAAGRRMARSSGRW